MGSQEGVGNGTHAGQLCGGRDRGLGRGRSYIPEVEEKIEVSHQLLVFSEVQLSVHQSDYPGLRRRNNLEISEASKGAGAFPA